MYPGWSKAITKRWFITGCSDGLGAAIARAAVEAGHDVFATARNVATLHGLVRDHGDRLTPFQLDVTDAPQMDAAIAQAGPVDVLVNNAGHGYLAAVEEGEDAKIRRTFQVNFFGAAALIRAVLPGMRERGDGTIVNVSSVAGFLAGAGSAYYAASKYALEGLSDALVAEAGALGIRVLIVEPGPIRTSFAGRSLLESPSMEAYAQTAGKRQRQIRESDGRQSGDPQAIARLIVELVDTKAPVQRVTLGAMAIRGVELKLTEVAADLEALRERSLATDFID
jgi:NAD(P)-dependent dehydrogenase (short-subunit alcohol dehydrogenase family)